MRKHLSSVLSISVLSMIVIRIGRCGTCMRQSLAVATTAWFVFGAGLALWPDSQVQILAGAAVLISTAIWLMHIAAYSGRNAAKAPDQPMRSLPANPTDSPNARRHALGILLRAAGTGVALSLPLIIWPSRSYAFCGQCTKNADCGEGHICKNTAAVNSGKICNECVAS